MDIDVDERADDTRLGLWLDEREEGRDRAECVPDAICRLEFARCIVQRGKCRESWQVAEVWYIQKSSNEGSEEFHFGFSPVRSTGISIDLYKLEYRSVLVTLLVFASTCN